MKKIIGLMLIGGFLLSANVSFASDVPQITKECVIDGATDMESVVIVGEVSLSVEKSVVLLNVKHIASVITMSAYNDTFEQFALTNKDRVDTSFNRYSDRTSIHESKSLTNKRNSKAYKFINKNCRTRELIQA